MKKFIKYGLLSVAALVIITFLGFYIWAQQTYKPTKQLTSLVGEVKIEDGWVIYEPKESKKTGVILYPGAKVEPEAYSYIAQQLSKQGYYVGIPEVTLNLAITSINKAEEMMEKYPSVEKWYVGGHSLGGVSAGSFAYDNLDMVDGLFFLGSYPMNSNDFSETHLPILSIYAERDGLTTLGDIEDSESLLSDETVLYEIKGGNHAQFGIYGPQKGDNEAEISVKDQQDIIVDVLLKWLQGKKL
ncbi:alpha/beta hydrolase [Bacillus sp. 165]|uniref:alpha/beta hydrolase n=1 Tax=Bacillus sp. 165 TaxID=1529117 RepID=UPI001AD997A1|nr:alpha/beta hydrolase [Bacillus sp. 165]